MTVAYARAFDVARGMKSGAGNGVIVAGALLPAVAAALLAVRSSGEYAQIAARYTSTANELEAMEYGLASLLPDLRRIRPGTRSRELHAALVKATDAMFHEVQGWSAVLFKKSRDLQNSGIQAR